MGRACAMQGRPNARRRIASYGRWAAAVEAGSHRPPRGCPEVARPASASGHRPPHTLAIQRQIAVGMHSQFRKHAPSDVVDRRPPAGCAGTSLSAELPRNFAATSCNASCQAHAALACWPAIRSSARCRAAAGSSRSMACTAKMSALSAPTSRSGASSLCCSRLAQRGWPGPRAAAPLPVPESAAGCRGTAAG